MTMIHAPRYPKRMSDKNGKTERQGSGRSERGNEVSAAIISPTIRPMVAAKSCCAGTWRIVLRAQR